MTTPRLAWFYNHGVLCFRHYSLAFPFELEMSSSGTRKESQDMCYLPLSSSVIHPHSSPFAEKKACVLSVILLNRSPDCGFCCR